MDRSPTFSEIMQIAKDEELKAGLTQLTKAMKDSGIDIDVQEFVVRSRWLLLSGLDCLNRCPRNDYSRLLQYSYGKKYDSRFITHDCEPLTRSQKQGRHGHRQL